ncbi:MAG TPA: YceD family protein [Burkholderiaceae bacterium]
MSVREFDPLRLDVALFAKEAGALAGEWPLRQLERVAASSAPGAPVTDADAVRWTARGELHALRGGEVQTWLAVGAATQVALECQRCLKPVDVPLQIARRFLFVQGEDAAAQLDTDSEDDVLALTRALDLRELIEDELLLAMPIVPRHEVCPEPLALPDDDDGLDEAPNPFAALAALKTTKPN